MNKKPNKPSWMFVCLVGVCMLLLTFSSQAFAKKNRLSVGFTAEEALENTRLNETWQNSEMGSVFWPLVYDQFWILGPAPDMIPCP